MTKVKAPVPYARLGNQRSSEVSPIAFADYKTDKDADPIERPTKVALVDTRSSTLRTVELGTSYWFRSLGRTPEGDGLVLGYDGKLHVIDVETARVTTSLPVIRTWKENADWQKPGPNLYVQEDMAYITEPATRTIHAVDLTAMEVVRRGRLTETPNELDGVTGAMVKDLAADHSGHDH